MKQDVDAMNSPLLPVVSDEEENSEEHSDSEAYNMFKMLQSRHNLFGEDEDGEFKEDYPLSLED